MARHTCIMTTEGYGEPIITTGPRQIEDHDIVIGSKDPKVRDRIVKLTDPELAVFDPTQNHAFTYQRVK